MTDDYKKGLVTGLAMQPLYVVENEPSLGKGDSVLVYADVDVADMNMYFVKEQEMKDFINIYLGALSPSSEASEQAAYAENACSEIAKVVGWTAEGNAMINKNGDAKLTFGCESTSSGTPYLRIAIGTRATVLSPWVEQTIGATASSDLISKDTTAGLYAILAISVSGVSWTMGLSPNYGKRTVSLYAFSDSMGRVMLHNTSNLSVYYNGNTYGTATGNIIASRNIGNEASSSFLIAAANPLNGGIFDDVYELVCVEDKTLPTYGTMYKGQGCYFRYIGKAYALMVEE